MEEKKKKIDKKRTIIYGVILIFIILIVVLLFLYNPESSNKNSTQKEKLTSYLENYGKKFYENYYYGQVSEIVEDIPTFLENFNTKGIEVSLNIMIEKGIFTESEISNKMKNNKETCNLDNTKVIIYPKEPYKKDSYKISTNLDCGTLE